MRKSFIVCNILSLLFLASAGRCADTNDRWTNTASFRVATEHVANYKEEPDGLHLTQGDFFIEPGSSLPVHGRRSTVQAKKGALIYARINDKSDRYFILLESAKVALGNKQIPLSAGEELFVSDQEPGFKEILADDIGRRRIKVQKLHDNLGICISEFSILQSMEREPLVHGVLQSDTPRNRALKQKLLKTAAVLNLVTGKHGVYASTPR